LTQTDHGPNLEILSDLENAWIAPARGPGLTRRQRDIIRLFEDFIGRNGYAPSLREIGAAVGLKAPQAFPTRCRSCGRWPSEPRLRPPARPYRPGRSARSRRQGLAGTDGHRGRRRTRAERAQAAAAEETARIRSDHRHALNQLTAATDARITALEETRDALRVRAERAEPDLDTARADHQRLTEQLAQVQSAVAADDAKPADAPSPRPRTASRAKKTPGTRAPRPEVG
jgi:hypothetical protein